ncbi:2-hydroxyacid dehydrogenase [Roseivirga sp.]|uniref:2-hydroxyacid dehydrogenase n=1 Tax=Roseivirga sp. TaxID=1964215 RepID=UPI003B8DBCED
MEILISSSVWDPKPWVEGLSASRDITKIHVWPTTEDISKVEVLFVWKPLAEGIINKLPKLKWISSLGAGVDHLTSDPQIPSHIPITRIVDPFLARDMTNYVIMGLMMHQRSMLTHLHNQRATIWDRITYQPLKVGIMGLGALGSHLAERLVLLGFEVFGYSRTLKDIDGVKCFDATQNEEFLNHAEVLVNLLPVTPQTESILNANLFRKMPEQSYLINVARGNHLVEKDLVEALNSGRLSGALLDVFKEEPLPTDNPLWQHEKVTITPHVASVTTPESAIKLLLINFELLNNNQKLLHQIDLEQGY